MWGIWIDLFVPPSVDAQQIIKEAVTAVPIHQEEKQIHLEKESGRSEVVSNQQFVRRLY